MNKFDITWPYSCLKHFCSASLFPSSAPLSWENFNGSKTAGKFERYVPFQTIHLGVPSFTKPMYIHIIYTYICIYIYTCIHAYIYIYSTIHVCICKYTYNKYRLYIYSYVSWTFEVPNMFNNTRPRDRWICLKIQLTRIAWCRIIFPILPFSDKPVSCSCLHIYIYNVEICIFTSTCIYIYIERERERVAIDWP